MVYENGQNMTKSSECQEDNSWPHIADTIR